MGLVGTVSTDTQIDQYKGDGILFISWKRIIYTSCCYMDS